MPRLLAIALLSSGCVTAIERSYTFSEDIHTIDFGVEAGEVTIVPSQSGQVELDVEFGGLGRAAGPEVVGGVLMMDYHCEGLGICGGELTLAVPDGVFVYGHLSMGDLQVEGLTGPVELTVDSGSISAVGLRSHWINLATGAGDVSVELLDRPEELHAAVGAGAVDLEVPAGSYNIETDMNIGAITLDEITDDPGADALISARAGAGDVTIRGW